MSSTVQATIVIVLALILGVAVMTYFSPYQGCVRAYRAVAAPGSAGAKPGHAELSCSRPSH